MLMKLWRALVIDKIDVVEVEHERCGVVQRASTCVGFGSRAIWNIEGSCSASKESREMEELFS